MKGINTILSNYPLLRSMVLYIFLVSIVITVSLASINMYFEYRHSIRAIHGLLDTIENNQVEVLKNSVWTYNMAAIKIQLDSIIQNEHIVYLELFDDDGMIYKTGTKPKNFHHIITRKVKLHHDDYGESRFLGSFSVYATTENIRGYLLRQLPALMATQFISSIIICTFVLVLFYFLFNRHLLRIVKFTKELNVDSLGQQLDLKRKNPSADQPDELDRIVNAINSMQKRLLQNIIKIEETDRSLRESEFKFHEIAENIRDVFWLFDWKHKKVIYVNPAYETIWGRSKQDLYERYEEWAESIHPDDMSYAQESFAKIIETGGGEPREYRIIRPDGSIRWIFDRGFAIKDEDGNIMHITGIAEDITERKKLEEELQKIHKLKSLGILAGGIAHDFNNLLTGIMNNIYLSKLHLDRESMTFRQLESAEKAVARGSELTQQLLTFSRGGAPIKRTSAIGDLIKEVAGFVLRGSNIKCEYKIPENIWPVDVDKGQISQVIQNIIMNAEQAMPGGGTILIEVENALVGSGVEMPLSKGRYVKITIHDQGKGISKDNLQKIFDPYFTTKEMGRGLGLSISYSIIMNHNGHISVESEPGQGTKFDIYLPASDQQIVTQQVAEDSDQTGEGKVLIMDDEEFIRSSLGEILIHKGYEVEFARDGAEALEMYKKAMKLSKTFDVVILDLTVPGGMGGEEAIKKLRAIDPKIKAIVSSGYSNNPILANFKDYGFSAVLSKPYNSPTGLNKVLQSVIRDCSG